MEIKEYERVWLEELARRLTEGRVPFDYRDMMVALRDTLPSGFSPDDVNTGLANRSGPTVLGFSEIGDPAGILPEIARAIAYVSDAIVADRAVTTISASS